MSEVSRIAREKSSKRLLEFLGSGMSARSASTPKRREEVLRAASELFLEKGYEATSTADIAERLGIRRASIYYYLETKEGLLFELMENVYSGFLVAAEEIRRADGSASERLRRLIRKHVSYLLENLVPTTLYLTEFRSLTPEHLAVVARQEEAYRRAVRELVEQAQREGSVRPEVDPEIATMALLGAANWIHRWYRDGKASPEEIVRQFELILVGGLER
jgi:AcrR family transcriptional regulator